MESRVTSQQLLLPQDSQPDLQPLGQLVGQLGLVLQVERVGGGEEEPGHQDRDGQGAEEGDGGHGGGGRHHGAQHEAREVRAEGEHQTLPLITQPQLVLNIFRINSPLFQRQITFSGK